MRVTLLGTGTSQGIPIIGCDCEICQSKDPKDQRSRSSLYIESHDGDCFLIDTSPDLRTQFLANKVTRLDGILYTHEHNDHTAGLDDIRPVYFRQRTAMPVYGHERVLKSIKSRYSYIFAENPYPGLPEISLNEVYNHNFTIKTTEFIPIPVFHGNLEILGFRIKDFAYLTDVKSIPDSSYALLEGVNTLVINALRFKPHFSHLNLEEAIEEIEKIGASYNILTHLSHKFPVHNEFIKQLPKHVVPGYDGMIVTI